MALDPPQVEIKIDCCFFQSLRIPVPSAQGRVLMPRRKYLDQYNHKNPGTAIAGTGVCVRLGAQMKLFGGDD